jgi:hypothetical protein
LNVAPGLQLNNGPAGPTLSVDNAEPFQSYALAFIQEVNGIPGTPLSSQHDGPPGAVMSSGLAALYAPKVDAVSGDVSWSGLTSFQKVYNSSPFKFNNNEWARAFKFNDVWTICPIRVPRWYASSFVQSGLGVTTIPSLIPWGVLGINEGHRLVTTEASGTEIKIIAKAGGGGLLGVLYSLEVDVNVGIEYILSGVSPATHVDARLQVSRDVGSGWESWITLDTSLMDWKFLSNAVTGGPTPTNTGTGGSDPHSHSLNSHTHTLNADIVPRGIGSFGSHDYFWHHLRASWQFAANENDKYRIRIHTDLPNAAVDWWATANLIPNYAAAKLF